MSDESPCLKGHLKLARLMMNTAVFLMAVTVVASIFAAPIYSQICICKVNLLAYAWIAWGITVMLSLIALVSGTAAMACSCGCKKLLWPNILALLQAVALLSGVVFMLLFITRLTDVI